MLIFIVFLSLTNLAIGYIVAVKFHTTIFPEQSRERELVRTSRELMGAAPPFSIDASQMPLVNRQPPLVAIPEEKLNSSSAMPTVETATTKFEPASAIPHQSNLV